MDDDIFDVESDAASSDFVPEPAPVCIFPLRVEPIPRVLTLCNTEAQGESSSQEGRRQTGGEEANYPNCDQGQGRPEEEGQGRQ